MDATTTWFGSFPFREMLFNNHDQFHRCSILQLLPLILNPNCSGRDSNPNISWHPFNMSIPYSKLQIDSFFGMHPLAKGTVVCPFSANETNNSDLAQFYLAEAILLLFERVDIINMSSQRNWFPFRQLRNK
jgi:hypothetical protein